MNVKLDLKKQVKKSHTGMITNITALWQLMCLYYYTECSMERVPTFRALLYESPWHATHHHTSNYQPLWAF